MRHNLAVLATLAALQGCAALPAGSELGWYYRIGPDANKSFAYNWTNAPRDPRWECPGPGKPGVTPGVPTWMDCKPLGAVAQCLETLPPNLPESECYPDVVDPPRSQ